MRTTSAALAGLSLALGLAFGARALPATAAPPSPSPPIDQAELEKRLDFYRSWSKLEAAFRQVKKLKDLGIELKSEGTLTVVRPDHVIWQIDKPSPLKITLANGQVRMESGEGSAARTDTFSADEAAGPRAREALEGLVAWLKLDVAAISARYAIFPDGENRYRFVPREAGAMPFRELHLTLGARGEFKRLEIEELSGDSVEIDFGFPKLVRSGK